MENKHHKKTPKIFKKTKFFIFLLSILITTRTHAQLKSPIEATSFQELIGIVITGLLGVVGSLSLIMFIYGGFLWIMSGGNEDNVKKGKDTLKWAVMGIVVVFASYGILNFVLDMLS